MTMNKGERGPLYYNKAGGGHNGSSGVSQSNSRIVPATQADLGEITIYEGDVLKGRYDLIEILADGRENGQGVVARGRRRKDGREVVVKQYSEAATASWDEMKDAEIGAAREIHFLKRANRDGVRGVPNLLEYGVTGDFIKQPASIFDPILGRNTEEIVLDSSYAPSMEEARKVIQLLEEPLEYAHTFGVQPVVHREVNPKNIMINGDGAVLIDWATSKATSGKTKQGTQFVTLHFTAPELLKGEEFDGRADVFGSGRVLQYMLLGADLFSASDGKPSLEDFQYLSIPKELPKVLERATQEDPQHRYRTAREFYDALNGGLEKITGRSLSVPEQEPEIVAVESTGEDGLSDYFFPTFVMGPDSSHPGMKIKYRELTGFLSIGGNVFGEGGDLYERGKDVWNGVEFSDFTDEEKAQVMRYYFKNLAQKNPILLPVANREQTPEQLYEEVKSFRKFANDFYEENDCLGKPRLGELVRFRKRGSKKRALEEHSKRVGELEAVVSGAKGALGGWVENMKGSIGGFVSGAVGSYFLFGHYLDPTESLLMVALTLGGAKLGSNIQRAYRRRKLKKKFREMDSWLERPESPKKLEDIAAGTAGAVVAGTAIVAGGAGTAIVAGAVVVAGTGVAGAVVVAAAGAAGAGTAAGTAAVAAEAIGLPRKEQNYHIRRGLIYGSLGAAANVLQALFLPIPLEQKIILGAGVQTLSSLIEPSRIIGEYYLSRRRALRQKRLAAAGLEGDVGKPKEGWSFGPRPKLPVVKEYSFVGSPKRLKKILSQNGLRRKRLGRRFVNEKGDVEVSYIWNPIYFSTTDVKVRALTPKIAEPVTSVIEGLWNPEQEPEVISGGGG